MPEATLAEFKYTALTWPTSLRYVRRLVTVGSDAAAGRARPAGFTDGCDRP